MYYICFFLDIYNFNNILFNLGLKSHFVIKIFKNIWKKYNYKNNNIIINVKISSNKIFIKKLIELIFNVKIIKVNTLIIKNKKKAFVKFFIL